MILSQKDPRWANILLGTSNYYIWAKGCLITELAEVLNTTPDIINVRLNEVDGFAPDSTGQKCRVIWAKLSAAFPEFTFRRVWEYNNEAVLSAINNHDESVIVEVDAAPIGGTGSHWVRYIGDQKLHNPWNMPGTEEPTSNFPTQTGFVVIGKAGQVADQPAAPAVTEAAPVPPAPTVETTYKGLDLTNVESVKAAIDAWSDVANGLYVKADEYVTFKNRICEALSIGVGTSIDDIVSNITILKEDFKKQVLVASGIPDAAQIEGQGPVSTPVPPVPPEPITMKNLPPHEKQSLMNRIAAVEAEFKDLLGLNNV